MNITVMIMARHLVDNYDQTIMLAINFNDELHPGTFEHALHYLIENRIETDAFNVGYGSDQTGRRSYNPKMLWTVIVVRRFMVTGCQWLSRCSAILNTTRG